MDPKCGTPPDAAARLGGLVPQRVGRSLFRIAYLLSLLNVRPGEANRPTLERLTVTRGEPPGGGSINVPTPERRRAKRPVRPQYGPNGPLLVAAHLRR